jgi:membrane-associated protein
MDDAIIQLVEGAVLSPWVYVALFGFAAVDGFLPLVPSESLVITAGVFAANGEPSLPLVIAAAALGAFAGDHVSFAGGRKLGARALGSMRADTRRRRAVDWASRALTRRGGLVLIVCRYIPGARTATTITAGAVGYPARSFSLFVAIAAGSWAVYSALVGYIGGAAFEENPLNGLLLGLGLAVGLTVLVEVARRIGVTSSHVR